ncbi:MAG: multicopper oxidase domain-containing protein [Geminicoccales bacterium]
MKLTRRSTLGLMTVGGAAIALGGYSWSRQNFFGPTRPLIIPPLIEGMMQDGTRNFDLKLGRHATQFIDGVNTPTFGINGTYLGPTLRLRAGSRVRINVQNDIGEPSTLHWHGMHVPAKADGGPHQVIENGASWHPEFEVKQSASTFWYHSHMMPRTGFQVYHGLAGMIIVEDEKANALELPQDYGVNDIPLILQDRRFGADGTFEYLSSMHDRMMGMTGNTLLVNGTANPHFVARTNSIRLRILNGSNSRIYTLAFNDNRRFHQVASDGGLLEGPFETDAITLAPAERAEIIVNLSDGKPATLLSTTPSLGGMMGRGMMSMMMGGDESFKVLEIRPDERRTQLPVLPKKLVELEAPDPTNAVPTRTFSLDMGMGMGMMMGGGAMTINGRSMDMNRIDETVRIGTREIWQIENPSMMPHPFHIHDVQFRILDRNGMPPGPGERGNKDTVLVNQNERVRLLLGFSDYADAQTPYMFHCHNLEHEDAGMMGQFVVVS